MLYFQRLSKTTGIAKAPLALLLTAVSLAVCLAAASAAQIPLSDAFQVNAVVAGDQDVPRVAVAPDGRFVAVWSGPEIHARRFDDAGRPIGSGLQVNSQNIGLQSRPAVAVQNDGDFLVVWENDTNQVRGRMFSAAGIPRGDELILAEQAFRPQVDADGLGRFVVVWQSGSGPQTSYLLLGQQIDVFGDLVGAEFEVGEFGYISEPDIDRNAAGDFVVTWNHYTKSPLPESRTRIRRFARDTTPLGPQAFAPSPSHTAQSSVGIDRAGDFVVAWHQPKYGSEYPQSVGGQAYEGGTAQGAPFTIAEPGRSVSLAAAPDGRFLSLWLDLGVQAGAFTADGLALGGPVAVSPATTGVGPIHVDGDEHGRFVAVWSSASSAGNDTSSRSIQARRLGLEGLFADGFESGDPLAWGRVQGVPGCLPSVTLTCDEPGFYGDNGGAGTTQVLTDYPCFFGPIQTGPERAYLFTPLESGSHSVRLTGLDRDLNLALLQGDCLATSCLIGSQGPSAADEFISFDAVVGETYFVVVDGDPGQATDFELILTCPE